MLLKTTMLASLRQTSSKALPLLFPKKACSRHIQTHSLLEEEAFSALDAKLPPATPTSTDSLLSTTAAADPPTAPNLDTMHHFLPAAHSPILQLITTISMKHGKYASSARSTAQMLLHIHAMTRSRPMPIVEHAVMLASPAVRIRKQKQGGGKTVLKPMALSERQRTRQGVKWIVEAADGKGEPGNTRAQRLARAVLDIVKGEGPVIKWKSDMHKAAMVNRGNLPKRF